MPHHDPFTRTLFLPTDDALILTILMKSYLIMFAEIRNGKIKIANQDVVCNASQVLPFSLLLGSCSTTFLLWKQCFITPAPDSWLHNPLLSATYLLVPWIKWTLHLNPCRSKSLLSRGPGGAGGRRWYDTFKPRQKEAFYDVEGVVKKVTIWKFNANYNFSRMCYYFAMRILKLWLKRE